MLRKYFGLIFLISCIIYVNQPVAVIQMDLTTQGDAELLIDNKDVAQNRLPNGKLRIVVYGLNQEEFEGKFLEVSDDVTAIDNIVAADPDAQPVAVELVRMNSPRQMEIVTE